MGCGGGVQRSVCSEHCGVIESKVLDSQKAVQDTSACFVCVTSREHFQIYLLPPTSLWLTECPACHVDHEKCGINITDKNTNVLSADVLWL